MKYYSNKEKYIKEGRGIGYGDKYKPWLDIRSFPSEGRVTRIKSCKTQRVHHFMSDLELKYFYILEWGEDIIDIREQFPLIDTGKTLEIAQQKGIKHPIDRKDKSPYVLTTDFMITKKVEDKEIYLARTIKYASDLNKSRVIELFEIEKEYWEGKGVNWGIITEKDIPKVLVDNIRWVHKASDLDELMDHMNITDDYCNKLLKILEEKLYLQSNQNIKILEFIKLLDDKYNLEDGTFLYLFRYSIFHKLIRVNMNKNLNSNLYIKDIIIC